MIMFQSNIRYVWASCGQLAVYKLFSIMSPGPDHHSRKIKRSVRSLIQLRIPGFRDILVTTWSSRAVCISVLSQGAEESFLNKQDGAKCQCLEIQLTFSPTSFSLCDCVNFIRDCLPYIILYYEFYPSSQNGEPWEALKAYRH